MVRKFSKKQLKWIRWNYWKSSLKKASSKSKSAKNKVSKWVVNSWEVGRIAVVNSKAAATRIKKRHNKLYPGDAMIFRK